MSLQFRLTLETYGPGLQCPRPVLVGVLEGEVPAAPLPAGHAAAVLAALAAAAPDYAGERLAGLPPLDAAIPDTAPALVARLALLLQRWAGLPVHRAAALAPGGEFGDHALFYEYRVARIAAAAGSCAALLAGRALAALSAAGSGVAAHDSPFDAECLEVVAAFIAAHCDAPLAARFVCAAEARDIPWRAAMGVGEFFDFGEGRRQRRIWKNFTGVTGHIATIMSSQKSLANRLFRARGIPAPAQSVVVDADAAVAAARTIGFPVVVKPLSTDFGTAVHVGLSGEAAVRAAFAVARAYGDVLVERHIPGDHHRLMVINGRLDSARRQIPAHVVGDGEQTVRALVEAANRQRRANGWKPIPLDAEAEALLAEHGFAADAVPPVGARVQLRGQANLTTGGTMEIVTDRIHPDNVRMAERATRLIGIDVAGIDFITPDISRSWTEVGGGICEINVTPGLIFGEEERVLAGFFPDGEDGRIPKIVVLDGEGMPRLSGGVAALLARAFAPVCVATAHGLYLGKDRIAIGDHAGWRGAWLACGEPAAGAAVIELKSAEIVRHGLAFDRCTAVIVGPPPEESDAAGQRARRLAHDLLKAAGAATISAGAATGAAAERALLAAIERNFFPPRII